MQVNPFKNRVLEYLPKKPYCSDDKTARYIRAQRFALKKPYIQLNPPSMCAWLIFDIDQAFTGEFAWEKHGLPVPNFFTMGDNGRYHIAYAIKAVCTSENARAKPLAYLAAVQRTLRRFLDADKGYAHLITKNPLSAVWRVSVLHNYEYSLDELRENFDTLDPVNYERVEELDDYARNSSLFNTLRFYAYSVVNEHGNLSDFTYTLETKAHGLNSQFKVPMDEREVRGICKSVSQWTWKHRHNIRVKERKLALDRSQPLATRQSLGALYTNQKRTEGVLERMKESYQYLCANSSKKVTQKAVAEHAKVSLKTAKRHWKSLVNF